MRFFFFKKRNRDNKKNLSDFVCYVEKLSCKPCGRETACVDRSILYNSSGPCEGALRFTALTARPPPGLRSAVPHPGPFGPAATEQLPAPPSRGEQPSPRAPRKSSPRPSTRRVLLSSPLSAAKGSPALFPARLPPPPPLPITAARGTPGAVVLLSARAAPPPGDGTSNPVVPRAAPSARCVMAAVVKLWGSAAARAARGTAWDCTSQCAPRARKKRAPVSPRSGERAVALPPSSAPPSPPGYRCRWRSAWRSPGCGRFHQAGG